MCAMRLQIQPNLSPFQVLQTIHLDVKWNLLKQPWDTRNVSKWFRTTKTQNRFAYMGELDNVRGDDDDFGPWGWST
jgi:hypothetical protein